MADHEKTGIAGQARGKCCRLLNTTDGLLVGVADSLSVSDTRIDYVWDVRDYRVIGIYFCNRGIKYVGDELLVLLPVESIAGDPDIAYFE